MPPTAPPANLTGWQYIAFFAILSVITLLQSYFMNKKIDAAGDKTADKAATKIAAATAPEEKKP